MPIEFASIQPFLACLPASRYRITQFPENSITNVKIWFISWKSCQNMLFSGSLVTVDSASLEHVPQTETTAQNPTKEFHRAFLLIKDSPPMFLWKCAPQFCFIKTHPPFRESLVDNISWKWEQQEESVLKGNKKKQTTLNPREGTR